MKHRSLITSVGALMLLGACDEIASPPAGAGTVSVGLAVASLAGPSVSIAPTDASGPTMPADAMIPGSNGTLSITSLHVIMTEFELDGEDDGRTCIGDDCEDFREGPLFIDVPLDGGVAAVTRGPVPIGDYRELEFEVEDLDDDEENPAERERIAELLRQIRGEFPDWPREASLRVAGSFQPADGGAPADFVVYVEAEVEVELELTPHLVVAEGDQVTVPVQLDLNTLFRRPDGSVLDLSRLDFADTGDLLEIEVELENGFVAKAEFDD